MVRLEVRDHKESRAQLGTRAPWVCLVRWVCRACPGHPVLQGSPARADLREGWEPRERGETTGTWAGRAPRARKVTEDWRDRGAGRETEASGARPELQDWTLLVLLGRTVSRSRAVAGGRKTSRDRVEMSSFTLSTFTF